MADRGRRKQKSTGKRRKKQDTQEQEREQEQEQAQDQDQGRSWTGRRRKSRSQTDRQTGCRQTEGSMKALLPGSGEKQSTEHGQEAERRCADRQVVDRQMGRQTGK